MRKNLQIRKWLTGLSLLFISMSFADLAFGQDQNNDALEANLVSVPIFDEQHRISSDCELLQIGLFETGAFENVSARLDSLGYNYTLIAPTSDIDVFELYDIIYLPSNWAQVSIGHLDELESNAEDFKSYVHDGGSLVVEQANPFQQPNHQVRPALLPYPILFDNSYNLSDMPLVIVDDQHPLTKGFAPEELPFPADQMIEVDSNYQVLTRGLVSGAPGMVVTEFGTGKVLVLGYSLSLTGTFTVSDNFGHALMEWAGSCGLTVGLNEDLEPNNSSLNLNPNVFNANTLITINLAEAGNAQVRIFDSRGMLLETVVSEELEAGTHRLNWQAERYQNGLYFCELVSGNGRYRNRTKFFIR